MSLGRRPYYREYSIIQNGMTEEGFVEAVREDIMRKQLVDSLLTGITPPKILAHALSSHETEKRSASFVIVDTETVGEVPQPSPAQIQKFYTENSVAIPYRKCCADLRQLSLGKVDFIAKTADF